MLGQSEALAAVAQSTTGKKAPTFWKKLIDGANVKGSFRTWKAGDSRSEFSALLNVASAAIIFTIAGTGAYISQKYREIKQESSAQRELVKVQEYKEVTLSLFWLISSLQHYDNGSCIPHIEHVF